jgi:hypothetical protein
MFLGITRGNVAPVNNNFKVLFDFNTRIARSNGATLNIG